MREAADAIVGFVSGMDERSYAASELVHSAVERKVAGKAATGLLDWTPDPAILRLVRTWPGNVASARANALGLQADTHFESVVREYIRENPGAVKLPLQ